MKFLLFIVLLISAIITAGCVGENKNNISTSTQTTITTGQRYVTEVTPFLTITPTTIAYNTPRPITQVPEDIVCMIEHKEQVFTSVNKYASAFVLVNPPMYINYTILDTKKGSDGKYASYYTITIRDKKTGTIISQSGFGKDRKQGGYFNDQFGGTDVIRVMKSNDLLIEKEGKDITIISEIWVKPAGNLDSSFDVKNAKCINWPQAYKEGVMHSPWGQIVLNFAIERSE